MEAFLPLLPIFSFLFVSPDAEKIQMPETHQENACIITNTPFGEIKECENGF